MGQPIKNMVDYERFFSKEMNDLLAYINEDYLRMFPVKEITTEMFFSAALTVDTCMLYKIFDCFINSFELTAIQNKLSDLLQAQTITAIKPGRKIEYSKELKNLFSKSLTECTENGDDLITSDHALLALLNTENGNEYTKVKKIFNERGINYSVALDRSRKIHDLTDSLDSEESQLTTDADIQEIYDDEDEGEPIAIRIMGSAEELKHLDIPKLLGDFIEPGNSQKKTQTKEKTNKGTVQYCTNLNEEAKEGKIDGIIGREKEINRIVKILNRRNSNNVLLIGGSGCGKTTIVKGLAKKITEGTAPSAISDNVILSLNTNELVAGTRLRGMVESRMTTLYKDIKKRENTILFIDDFHSFFNEKKDDDYNMIALLLPILQDKDCKIIAATTYKGYKDSIEKNPEIVSRFNKIQVEEPTMSESKEILWSLKSIYEKYHNVTFSEDIIELVLSLCKKYESHKSLVCAAIDVIDEIGAKKYVDKQETQDIIEKRGELEKAITDNDTNKILSLRLELTKLLNTTADDDTTEEITSDDVYTTFSEYENIPITKLNVSEKQQISQIDKTLNSVIIGQENAIKTVSRAIKRSKVGLSPHTKPLATFLMVGSTGTGKCVCGDTIVTIKNKKTNEIEKISINEFIKKYQ